MFDYKSEGFYTEYFDKSEDFKVITPFSKSKEKGEENLYIGEVEVLDTIHPLKLRVEIPVTFPHNKMTFRTKSLFGYPHLIHTGKIENGDWFCLNTPFAETAIEQLNQEVLRLKEWIRHQMREDLPPVIKDPNVKKALRIANAYEWENPDEVKEFSSKAILTLVGEGFTEATNFKSKKGCFYGVKSPDNRIYAFMQKQNFLDYKLPYIIISDFPEDTSVLEDFLKMKAFYDWDDDTCKHLLQGSSYHSGKSQYSFIGSKYGIELNLEQSLKAIDDIQQELEKDESYLDDAKYRLQRNKDDKDNKDAKIKVKYSHKPLLIAELDNIRKQVISNNGVKLEIDPWTLPINDEYDEEEAFMDQWIDHDQYIFDYFLTGVERDGKITWLLLYTNPATLRTEQVAYDVKVKKVYINSITSFNIFHALPQYVGETMFFGRGSLSKRLSDKRIAVVGLGAIGSLVVESLAHSGIKHIGLWDSDVVEPGNICRSFYQLEDLGNSKVKAIKSKILAINPFIKADEINDYGSWEWNPNWGNYLNGSFYDNVNYKSQEESIKILENYDVIIDCSGSNEMLHFLSYAVSDKELIALCITNHANELICTSNLNGNPFELRKAYLSRIAQDTKNFYVEGSGCYSPTFLAKYFDIASLVNFFVRDLDKQSSEGKYIPSCIYSYCENGILKDEIMSYCLSNYDIKLNVSREALLDAEEMFDAEGSIIGYVLGCYSANGNEIMITQIIPYQDATSILESAFNASNGIIDYIGDFVYSNPTEDMYSEEAYFNLLAKSLDPEVNTNNPLLAIKHQDGHLSFMLLINGELEPFIKED